MSADYVSSKHAVVGVTRATAVDYSSKGVRGPAIGRMGQPFEVAETVAWLLLEGDSWILILLSG
jgi:NAD(P)-dependent dehydrogenase (short-subunit alcohol dehydrogenase family)